MICPPDPHETIIEYGAQEGRTNINRESEWERRLLVVNTYIHGSLRGKESLEVSERTLWPVTKDRDQVSLFVNEVSLSFFGGKFYKHRITEGKEHWSKSWVRQGGFTQEERERERNGLQLRLRGCWIEEQHDDDCSKKMKIRWSWRWDDDCSKKMKIRWSWRWDEDCR